MEHIGAMLDLDRTVRPGTVAYEEHNRGRLARKGMAPGVRALWYAVAVYCDQYRKEYGRPVGDDYYAEPVIRQIIEGALELLNLDTGGLDGGSLDGNMRALAYRHGVELDGYREIEEAR